MKSREHVCCTITELGRLSGRSPKAVSGAIGRGDISAECVGVDAHGRRCITDRDRALAQLKQLDELREAEERTPAQIPAGVDVDDEATWPSDRDTLEAIKCHHAARCAKLRADEASGRLVDRDDVRRDCFTASRAARDHLLRLPDRLSNELAVETDAARVREMMSLEVERILRDFSAALRSSGGADDAAARD